jgi:hypothetical protein
MNSKIFNFSLLLITPTWVELSTACWMFDMNGSIWMNARDVTVKHPVHDCWTFPPVTIHTLLAGCPTDDSQLTTSTELFEFWMRTTEWVICPAGWSDSADLLDWHNVHTKFNQNPPRASGVVSCGRMDGQTWTAHMSSFRIHRARNA